MSTLFPPKVLVFESDEQKASYDQWFRRKVQAAIDDPRPGLAHEDVMAEMEAVISEAESRMKKK